MASQVTVTAQDHPTTPACAASDTPNGKNTKSAEKVSISHGEDTVQELQHTCETCGEVFTHARLLKRHLATEQAGKQFPCSLCGAVYLRLACLNVHVRTHTVVCNQCLISFISESSYRRHTCKPSDEIVFDCKNCGKEFRQRDGLLQHIVQSHVTENGFACEDCGKDMPTAAYLARHKKSCAAQAAKSFSCPECDAIFRSLSGLRLHLLSHAGAKPYTCLECGASFKAQTYLSCHIKRKHCKDRPFSCMHCSKAFPFQSALNLHMKSHHPESKDQIKLQTERSFRKTSSGTVDRQQKGVVEAVFDKSLSLSLPEESRDLSTTNVPAVGSVDCQLQRCFTAVSSRSQSLITGEEIVVPASTADDTSRIGDAGWDVEPANNAPSVWQDNDGMAESPVNVLVDFCTQEVPVVQLQAFDIGQSGRSPPESDETLQQEFQHVCKTCGESFAHARLLKRHLYIEQEGKEFSCSLWETKKKDKARKRYTEKTSEGKLPDNSEVSGQTEDTVELETVFGESQGKFPPLTEDAQFPTSDRDREGRGEPEQELEWSSDVLSVKVENDSGVKSGLDDLTGAPSPGDDRETEEATTEEQETSDDRETEEATTEEQETSDDRETEEATTEEQETSDDRETEEATTEEQETSDDRETEEATTEEQETSDDRETEEATTEEQETSDDRETEEATTEEQETSDDRETEEATTEEQETSDTNLISTPELDRNDSETEKHHVCETCGEVYSTAHLLTRHQRIQWEGDQYPCYLCDAVFPRTSCLHVHLRDHTFVCEQCQVVFVSQSSLKEHTCDCSRKTYECKKCKKECKERVELDEHIQTHITEHNHVCEYCGKQLPTATYLTRHKKSCATQSAKFACPKCKTMSGSLMSLRSHMKEKHTSDRSFFCTFCGKGFALKHRLDSHQKIHIDHRKRRAVVETHIRGQARRTKRRCPETSSNDAWDGFTRTKASPERKAMGKEGNGDKRDQDVESEMSDGLLESSLPWTQSETTKSTPVTISQADFDGSGEGPHTCGTCGATFQRAFLLKRHLDTRQEGRRFPCSLCEQVFPRSGCLHVHMQNHSFVCEQCQIVFITEISFRNHLCKGSEGNTYQCQKCAEVFRYQAALAEHIETHITEKGCICRKCGKELASAGYMERHKKTCGVKTSKFSCPQCEELFRTIRGLRLHLQSHSGVKPFTCELCGISFKAQQYLQCHKKQIHSSDRPFLCSQCPKAFAFKHRLNAHMKEHTSAGQHICQQCGSSFKTAEGLKCHLETHSDARPYICTECGRGFKQRTVLIRHVMTHTGVRGYKCRFCDAAFVHMSSLCRHERTHTGDRPYICKICSASFPDSGTLVIHRRLHTGEKPYVCSFCAMRFSDPSSMRKHNLENEVSGLKAVINSVQEENSVLKQMVKNLMEENDRIKKQLEQETDAGKVEDQ
ncbi:hypothetical protein BaRGS_00033006, partial [Batillaria attramentaria]